MIVLTAFTNYSKDRIHNYVNSLKLTGFTGRKMVVYYNPDENVKSYLEQEGWEVFTYPKSKYYINFQRRQQFSEIIQKYNLEEEYICCTDMKDVFFAKSPSDIKEDFYIEFDTNVPIEKHQWNKKSITTGYPEHYESIKHHIPFNSGVIIGKGKILKEFFDDFYSTGLSSGFTNIDKVTPGLDQSTVNFLMYTSYTHLLKDNKKYVLHMGNIDSNYNLADYYIYHQYERKKKHKEFVDNMNKKSYI